MNDSIPKGVYLKQENIYSVKLIIFLNSSKYQI